MSESDLIIKNTFINENIVNTGYLMRVGDITCNVHSYRDSANSNFFFDFSQNLPTVPSRIIENKSYQKNSDRDEVKIDHEENLTKFQDFKKFTNDLNSGINYSMFNPFSFIPFLKTTRQHDNINNGNGAKSLDNYSTSPPRNQNFNSIKKFPQFTKASHIASQLLKSASEKESKLINNINSKKLKDNQYMHSLEETTRSSSEVVSDSSSESFNEKAEEEDKKISDRILNTVDLKEKLESQINNKFGKNLLNRKQEREDKISLDSLISLPQLKREEGVFFHVEKQTQRRKRKNKFQKVMDLLKDSVLLDSCLKDSIIENLKEKESITNNNYSHDEYLMDMIKIKNDDGHSLMSKHFPNAYKTIEKFYSNFKIFERRRKLNNSKLLIKEEILSTLYNPKVGRNQEKNYFLFNEQKLNHDTDDFRFLPKKIWAPKMSEICLKDFSKKIEKIWPQQKCFYSEEYMLEFLMSLDYNYDLTYDHIINQSEKFQKFIEIKKQEILYHATNESNSENEIISYLKEENIPNRNYYFRKR
jgi:hypothetical protein